MFSPLLIYSFLWLPFEKSFTELSISMKYQSYFIALASILLTMLFFTKCINSSKGSADRNEIKFSDFAGSASCLTCHKNIYESHITTAHFHTSELANEQSIKGSFDTSKNQFIYNNGSVVAMEKRSNGLYQVVYINGEEKKSQRFDMVIGSGAKGQSFVSWVGNHLVQLPITYFTSADQWSNSPGYPNRIAMNRPISSRCMECHATYAEVVSAPGKEPEQFDKSKLIMGVDCEKCHGPAAKHVEFQTQNPSDKIAKYILNPANFTRQQSLDLCALCHGGRLQKKTASFSFKAGDNLADFFTIDSTIQLTDNIDVHGNQYGLLKASKCFQRSTTLTCVTCHNSHENEQGKSTVFSQKCMSCHNTDHANSIICKMTSAIGPAIKDNCIDCHMPEKPSMAIAVLLQGDKLPTPAKMHTHLIMPYPDETKKVLEYLKKNN